jgi:glutamyl-tRNA synthetase
MVNFLALLGWSPGQSLRDRELFSRADLVDAFDLSGISGGNAVFNTEKLDWFNQQHIVRLAPDELARRLRPSFEAAGLWDDAYAGEKHAWFYAVLELVKPRAKKLDEFVPLGRFFFDDSIEYEAAAVDKHLRSHGMAEHLTAVSAALEDLQTFDSQAIEVALRGTADARGVKAAALIHALRVALTGRSVSPGIFDVASLLGRNRVQRRIEQGVQLISA